MDRFLANADPDKRQQSIDLTRKMAAKRSRLHYLTNPKVSRPNVEADFSQWTSLLPSCM
jgi:hypothetical protein